MSSQTIAQSLPRKGALVSITQYERALRGGGSPIAVGRMLIDGDMLTKDEERKGKAAVVLHMWKDYLWEMGRGGEVPVVVAPPSVEGQGEESLSEDEDEDEDGDGEGQAASATPPPQSEADPDEGKQDEDENLEALSPEGKL